VIEAEIVDSYCGVQLAGEVWTMEGGRDIGLEWNSHAILYARVMLPGSDGFTIGASEDKRGAYPAAAGEEETDKVSACLGGRLTQAFPCGSCW
jgi:hypothetical protein